MPRLRKPPVDFSVNAPQKSGRIAAFFSFPRVTWLVSVLLFFIFSASAFSTFQSARTEAAAQLGRDADEAKRFFDLAVADIEQQMLVLTTLVAADPGVQGLFSQGKKAVEREGGGAGGAEAARIRAALHRRIAPQWGFMQNRFGSQQLQFLLGPQTFSFLRMHAPERFGDRLDAVRHIINDTMRDRQPRAGFETGRIFSGIRGVVPVWVEGRERLPEFVGVMETGTSLDTHLRRLDRQLGAGFAVFLDYEHVSGAMWQEHHPGKAFRDTENCYCFLESSSRPELREWLRAGILPAFAHEPRYSRIVHWKDKATHLIAFPLRDYLGSKDVSRPKVGTVLVWRDVTDFVRMHRNRQWSFVLFHLAAFLLAQILVLWLVRLIRAGFQESIDRTTQALRAERDLFAGGPVSVLVWRPEAGWPMEYASANVENLFGHSATAMLAQGFRYADCVHPDDLPRVTAEVQSYLAQERPSWEQRYRIVTGDRGPRWLYDFTTVERDAVGRVLRLHGYLLDITEQTNTSQRFTALIEALPDAVFFKDGQGRWQITNESAKAIFRLHGHPWQNKSDLELAAERPELRAMHEACAASDEAAWCAGALFVGEELVYGENGVSRRFEVRKMPLFEADGRRRALVIIGRDITMEYQARQELARLFRLNELLLANAGEGIYGVDRDGVATFINPAARRMLGFSEAEVLGSQQHLLFHHHYADGSEYPQEDCPVFRTLRDGLLRQVEDWFFRKDGSVFPVSCSVTPMLEDGEQLGAMVLFQDITLRRQATAALEAAHGRLAAVIGNFNAAVLVEDEERRIVLVNQLCCELFSIPMTPEEMVGMDCADSARQAAHLFVDAQGFAARIDQIIALREPVYAEEITMASGRTLERDYVPILADQAYFCGHLWVYRDVTETKEKQSELWRLATIDVLTGLSNRRSFFGHLQDEFDRYKRFNGSVALVSCDLDYFKLVNDTYGHQAGDDVLRHFVAMLRENLRKVDVAGRIGGEEFVVLLPGADAVGAVEFANRLRLAMANTPAPTASGPVPCTVSLGVTLFGVADKDVDSILARADRAMYQAKNAGRNRVESELP